MHYHGIERSPNQNDLMLEMYFDKIQINANLRSV